MSTAKAYHAQFSVRNIDHHLFPKISLSLFLVPREGPAPLPKEASSSTTYQGFAICLFLCSASCFSSYHSLSDSSPPISIELLVFWPFLVIPFSWPGKPRPPPASADLSPLLSCLASPGLLSLPPCSPNLVPHLCQLAYSLSGLPMGPFLVRITPGFGWSRPPPVELFWSTPSKDLPLLGARILCDVLFLFASRTKHNSPPISAHVLFLLLFLAMVCPGLASLVHHLFLLSFWAVPGFSEGCEA